ncbi:MAG TPA: hypothetical protein VFA78_01990 [Chloroflexota bacterium]|nr:hypothetical protein [Chloroflexota bacterium]
MLRASFLRFLIPVVVLAVIPFVQPTVTSAAPMLTIHKTACNMNTAAPCGTNISASNGQTVQYQLNYNNTGGAGQVQILDQLAAGQDYVTNSCVVNGTPPTNYSCNYNSSTRTLIFTAPNGENAYFNFEVTIDTCASGTIYNHASGTGPGGGGSVNSVETTAVTVNGSGGCTGTGPVTLTKAVADATTYGGWSNSTIYANPGDALEYQLTLTNNSGTTLNNVQITDPLSAGQTLVSGSCAMVVCSYNGNTVTFSYATVSPGSITVNFNVSTATSYNYGGSIYNTAYVSATNLPQVQSNTTQVVFSGFAPPPYYYYPYPTYVTSPTYYTNLGATTICGALVAFTSPTQTASGTMTINGETFILAPQASIVGGPASVGSNVCVAITLNSAGQVAVADFAPNYAGLGYVCGPLSQYVPGYYPYNNFNPYVGYNPSYTWTNYGPYPYNNWNGYYGWNGPMFISGYPYYVTSNTYFPYSPAYGSNYCFLMGANGSITGSLSVLATAARPATGYDFRSNGSPQPN